MKEERLQILQMIQEGLITSDEGAKLLAALSKPEQPKQKQKTIYQAQAPRYRERPRSSRRWLRIKVTDKANERDRVNLTLPIALVDWGLKMAESSAGVHLSAVRDVIRDGAEGKIIEVEDSSSGDRVEIFVE